jgi:hypothetical protein
MDLRHLIRLRRNELPVPTDFGKASYTRRSEYSKKAVVESQSELKFKSVAFFDTCRGLRTDHHAENVGTSGRFGDPTA